MRRCSEIKRFGIIDVLLLSVAAIWGLNFTAVKWALRDISPLAQVGFRIALSTAIFFVVLKLIEGDVGVERRYWGRLALIGFSGLALNQTFFVTGLKYTTVVNSSLIYATAPVYGLLLSGPLNKEKVGARQFLGLGVAFLGVIAVIGGGRDLSQLLDHRHLLGDILTLGAALAWSMYSLFAGPLFAGSKLSPLRVNCYTYLFATIALLPLTLPYMLRQDWRAVGPGAYGAVLYSAALSSVVAYVWWYKGVSQIGVARTMIYQYLVLPFGVLAAALLLRETVTLFHLLGGAVILTGIGIARWGPRGDYSPRRDLRDRETVTEEYPAHPRS